MINKIIKTQINQYGGKSLIKYIGFPITHFIIIFCFAFFYYILKGNDNFNGLDETSTFIDALYFSFTTQSTVGYGDISPKSKFAKILVMIQQTIVLLELASNFYKMIFQKNTSNFQTNEFISEPLQDNFDDKLDLQYQY